MNNDFRIVLIVVLSLILSSLVLNDIYCYQEKYYNPNCNLFTNPPPDSLIQELIVQVNDSSLTDYIQRLQDFWTRDVRTDSIVAASYWISNQFLNYGYSYVEFDSFDAEINSDTLVLWNVVATKDGYGDSSRVIIVGGHYDSAPCDWQTLEGPGADDNASGVAGTLEIARILAEVPLYDTVKIILFSCEEWSLQGSRHYANEADNQGMDIELMINLDMIGNLSDSIWDVKVHADTFWTPENKAYAELMVDLGWTYTILEPIILPRGPTSDHWPFADHGWNAIFAFESDFSPYWGTCDDLLENLTIPYAREVTKMVLATLVTTAQHRSEPSGIEDHDIVDLELPNAFSLDQNYPNPFNPTTTITFEIPGEAGKKQHVKLTVYDLRGKHVKTLIDSELEPGSHTVVWDGRAEQGSTVSSGIYIYSITSNNTSYSRKMVMIK